MTFTEMTRLLFPRTKFGMKLGLERMVKALAALGDPHKSSPVLHVAGTNGKGSTCAFTAAALEAAGLRVGLYTSPHLRHFCERIRVGGEDLHEEQAAALFEEIVNKVPWALDNDGLTFFELATAMAFLAFARAPVDVMVIEVGLGGRLDATNVVEPLACAISALGLDHTEHLGRTLAEIAREKAGICKRFAPLVSASQPLVALEVLEEEANRVRVPLWLPGRDYGFESRDGQPFSYTGAAWRVEAAPGLAGSHQRGNAALACALLECAADRGLPVLPEHAAAGLVNVRWPGRLQLVAENPLVVLDGAHNAHGAEALARSLPALLGGRPLQLVFGALVDKDATAMLRELAPLAAGVHLCSPASPRAHPAGPLLHAARAAAPKTPVSLHKNAALALEAARSDAFPKGAVVCCGSLYLVGELLAVLSGDKAGTMPGEKL